MHKTMPTKKKTQKMNFFPNCDTEVLSWNQAFTLSTLGAKEALYEGTRLFAIKSKVTHDSESSWNSGSDLTFYFFSKK